MLAKNLVVFESIVYGNALYIMHENWRENSQLDRLTLLAKAQRDFDRVPQVLSPAFMSLPGLDGPAMRRFGASFY